MYIINILISNKYWCLIKFFTRKIIDLDEEINFGTYFLDRDEIPPNFSNHGKLMNCGKPENFIYSFIILFVIALGNFDDKLAS